MALESMRLMFNRRARHAGMSSQFERDFRHECRLRSAFGPVFLFIRIIVFYPIIEIIS